MALAASKGAAEGALGRPMRREQSAPAPKLQVPDPGAVGQRGQAKAGVIFRHWREERRGRRGASRSATWISAFQVSGSLAVLEHWTDWNLFAGSAMLVEFWGKVLFSWFKK